MLQEKKRRSAKRVRLWRPHVHFLLPQLRQMGLGLPFDTVTSRAQTHSRRMREEWAYQHTLASMLVRPNLRNLFSTGTYVNVHGDDTQRMNAITVTVTKNRSYSDL